MVFFPPGWPLMDGEMPEFPRKKHWWDRWPDTKGKKMAKRDTYCGYCGSDLKNRSLRNAPLNRGILEEAEAKERALKRKLKMLHFVLVAAFYQIYLLEGKGFKEILKEITDDWNTPIVAEDMVQCVRQFIYEQPE